MQSNIIKESAKTCGFDLCGIAKATPLVIEKKRFQKALAQNFHAHKEYLERDIDKRFSPELLLNNCKSVIVCGFNYNTECRMSCEESDSTCVGSDIKDEVCRSNSNLKFSKHSQLRDYHIFIKEKLEKLSRILQAEYGTFNYKTTVDSANISEKAWAVQAGIGYYGKNGIIQTALGSFVFLGILLIDVEVDVYDNPNSKSCGTCRKCIAACPTKAITIPYYVNCNQCIAHVTSNKKETDFSHIAKYGWLNACDECQNACPNNFHPAINDEAIAMKAPFVENKNTILETLTPESFERYFKDTVIYPLKYEGLKLRLEAFSGVEKTNLIMKFKNKHVSLFPH